MTTNEINQQEQKEREYIGKAWRGTVIEATIASIAFMFLLILYETEKEISEGWRWFWRSVLLLAWILLIVYEIKGYLLLKHGMYAPIKTNNGQTLPLIDALELIDRSLYPNK